MPSRSIIAVTHPPKAPTKKQTDFSGGRSDYLGSASVSGSSSTIINLWPYTVDGAVESHQRLCRINGRDFSEFWLLYDLDEHGCLTNPQPWNGKQTQQLPMDTAPADTDLNNPNSEIFSTLDFWALAQPSHVAWPTSSILDFAQANSISRASAFRWIESALKRRVILKIDHGRYRKTIDAPEGATVQSVS